jgi:ATP-dependent helicase YprA (DUF1998 family)
MTTTLNSRRASSSKSVTRNAEGQNSADLVAELLETAGLPVHGTLELPGREPIYAEPPAQLDARVTEILADAYPAGLYSHQAEAIAAALNGEDVCLATSTASGKSLVFMATAMHELLQDPHARVLVLYPARALIQDQLAKWTTMLSRLGLKAGFIDGSVPQAERNQILLCRRVVLMTPDVAHTWLMNHLNDAGVVHENKVIHAAFFRLDDQDQFPKMASLSSRRRQFREYGRL